MRKLILMIAAMLAMSTAVQAEDHVMAATRGNKDQQPKVASLNLSLREAQDYAVEQGRCKPQMLLVLQVSGEQIP